MLFEVILFVVALIALDYFHKKRRNEVLASMPGPKPLPILGNALSLSKRTPETLFTSLLENSVLYGKMWRAWMFDQVAIFASDPKDIEVILSSSKHISKNSLYDTLIAWLGTGLLISTGQKWHARRKVITPAFHFKILEQFVEIFDQQGSEFVKNMKDKADGKTALDIYPLICRMAMDIIAETSMGTKVNAQQKPNFGYVQAVADITAILAQRLNVGWYRLDSTFRLFAPNLFKRQQDTIKTLHAFTENVIQDRRTTLEKQGNNESSKNEISDEFGSKKRSALLDVLLKAEINGKPLSNDDIREEVDTFMFEGHDTTTTGISFTLYLLSRNPEAQQKAYEEVIDVLGDDTSTPVTLHDLNNLKYLECVIKEGLRLFPPVPLIGRSITEDTRINDKMVPAGSDFTVGIFVMLRDPDYFPNPEAFIPERHNAENTAEKVNPYAYVPFSAGPRNCIGQKFAILEMKSTISKILRSYELLPMGPEVRPVISVILRSANGVHLGLKPRKP